MEFWRYYEVVRRRWWVPAIVAIIAVVTLTGVLVSRPPTYASTATLMVRTPAASNSVVVFSPSSSGGGLADQLSLIKTDIVTILGAASFYDRVARRFPEQALPGTYGATSIRDTSMITLTATGPTPRTAYDLARTVTDEFLGFYRDLNRSDAAESRAFLAEQVRRADARLAAADLVLERYRTTHGVPALEEQISGAVSRMAQFEVERDMADVSARQARARISSLQGGLASQSRTQISTETLVENPSLRDLRTRLTQLEIQLNEGLQVYTERHPRVIALRAEIASLQRRIPREASRVVGSQQVSLNPLRQHLTQELATQTAEYTAAIARRDSLTTVHQKMQAAIPRLNAAQRELAGLVREQKAAEAAHALLTSKLNEAVIKEQQAAYETISVRVVAAPMMPQAPIPVPRVPLLGAALMLGAALGLGIAFFAEYLEAAGVRTPAEAARAFGLPILGVIPTMNQQVYRDLTALTRPAWQTTTFIIVLITVAAAATMMGMNVNLVEEVSVLWQFLRAL